METIECKRCREAKGPEGFAPRSRSGWCKQCATAYAVQWAKDNPERFRTNQRRYELKVRFGITPEQYQDMLDDQGGVCAICKKPSVRRRLCVDHCHTTGKVRGLLCNLCNTGLGMLREDTALMRKAVSYLSTMG